MADKDKAKHDGVSESEAERAEEIGPDALRAQTTGDEVIDAGVRTDADTEADAFSDARTDVNDDGVRQVNDGASEGAKPMVVGAEVPGPSDHTLAPWVMGILTVHFPERDVELVLDGHNALRILALYAHGFGRGDFIDPQSSSQRAAWIALDLERALALNWWPRLPATKKRVAIDPPVPAETE